MIRILKDMILCGVPVHAGETFPAVDIPESDLSVIIGAGYAERFTPEVVISKTETTTPEPEPEKKTAKKRKK